MATEKVDSLARTPVCEVDNRPMGRCVRAPGGATRRGGGDPAVGGASEGHGRLRGAEETGGAAPTPPDSVFFAQTLSTA